MAVQSFLAWKIWSVCFMLLAGWTTNNVNLYSAALSLRSLFKEISFSSAMGLAGLIGCFLVFIPVLEQFALALDLIGIFVVAMGGTMFMAYLLESYVFVIKPFFMWMAWFFGIAAGLSAFMWPRWGSGAPVMDAGLVAMLALPCLLILDAFFKPIPQTLRGEIR